MLFGINGESYFFQMKLKPGRIVSLLLILCLFSEGVFSYAGLWYPVTIQSSHLLEYKHKGTVTSTNSRRAIVACTFINKCRLICDAENNDWSMWSIIVEAFLDETSFGDVIKCWTNQPRGNFVPYLNSVSIDGTPPLASNSRVKENLIDGWTSFNAAQNFEGEARADAYVSINLGEPIYVNTINVWSDTLSGLEIRVGNSSETYNGLLSHKLLEYQTSDSQLGTVVLSPPVLVQYVSLLYPDASEGMIISHIQIFVQRS